MIEETRRPTGQTTAAVKPRCTGGEAAATDRRLIDIDAFNRIDLRVARVVSAEHVDGADKLIKLVLDLGDSRARCSAGIKRVYAGIARRRLTVVVANLKPRQMRFGESQGMVLAAGSRRQQDLLLEPDTGAVPGMQVR